MLRLVDVKKIYSAGGIDVQALKGISISFREREFVSILGPSGCGKTTTLNIIGGLDHATEGDLIIDGVSTKEYNDRDWDTYRNHRVGFIFQSYNLIPHQTVIENVALALSISGISKKEREEKAKAALDRVGLGGLYKKKPNQLSGGQMQRVAIARALVNNPEILLADEPTGALDSVTSIQIMDLIKEISKDCLVIMVTHNPDLAKQYSNRIIELLDGEIKSDSNPFEITKNTAEIVEEVDKKADSTKKKSKLSFLSAFFLSWRNLWSKRKRTILVSVAGSIGIIGVAAVLAVSHGVTNYISDMENDMLAGNPVTIQEQTYDFNALSKMISNSDTESALKKNSKDGFVNVDGFISDLIKTSESLNTLQIENDITKEYIDYLKAMPETHYDDVVYDYGIDVNYSIYTDQVVNWVGGTDQTRYMSLAAIKQMYVSMLEQSDYSQYSSYINVLSDPIAQGLDSENYILTQYDYLTPKDSSRIPTAENEFMIVLGKQQELSDLFLAEMGYYSQDEFLNLLYRALGDSKGEYDPRYDESLNKDLFSYEEMLNKEFYFLPHDSIFHENVDNESHPFNYDSELSKSYMQSNGVKLKCTAILKQKSGTNYSSMSSGFYYSEAFAEKFIKINKLSVLAQELRASSGAGYYMSTLNAGVPSGLYYNFSYYFQKNSGNPYSLVNDVGFVGSTNAMSDLLASFGGSGANVPKVFFFTEREIGSCFLPNHVSFYNRDFDQKKKLTKYLDEWNGDGDIVLNGETLSKAQRPNEVVYTDSLSLIMSLVGTMINVVTIALVAFTGLSLVVSTVMIAIITYVSVIERIKEIGVIRSLGGRKIDVSNLFMAETFIIGSSSGVMGILITYILSLIMNLIVGAFTGIFTIANLPISYALIMILISIVLTSISGIIPANLASRKDPVEALRTE